MLHWDLPSLAVLAALLALVSAAAWIGNAATAPALPGWYASLNRPSIAPPNWVFPVAWTALFAVMAGSAWLVWLAGGRAVLALWLLQLVLNTLWSFVFFKWKRLGWATVHSAVFWVAILAMMVGFHAYSPFAAWLNLPYLLWVAFATLLSYRFWRLNG